MNARFRFAGLLLPVVLLGCNGMETRVTDSVKPGEVAIAPRFVSASAVPRVDRLNVTLAVSGRTDMVNDVAHSPGSTMVLGSVPVGSAYTVTALGYDTAADKKVERFWGKTSGKADSQSDATVVIALETGPTAPTAQADSLVVGGHLNLSPGMWYTKDGSDPRAGTAISANGPITIDKAGTVKAALLTPADSSTGTPALWSAVSSWTFEVAGSVVSKDTSLSGLTASPIVGSLVPEFTSVTLSYEATVDTGVTSVTVVGTPKLSGAQVSYGNGLSSGVVNLGTRTADTALEVTVTNGGKSMVYTVTLKRKVYAPVYTLKTSAVNGTITLTPNQGSYDSGKVVTATAEANSGYTFSGWSGACTGTGACSVTMTKDTSLTAYFAVKPKPTYTLTTSATNGTITLSSNQGSYDSGATVTATAKADTGYTFSGWSGACSGTGACTVTMTKDTSLIGNFMLQTGTGTVTDDRDKNSYKTVRIGTQVWMAQNLNYKVDSSFCYASVEANCSQDGRLYLWAAAMGLHDSCNTKSCATQVTTIHRGVCPSGWHVPSDAEWLKLTDTSLAPDSAGAKLKAKIRWSPVGIDDYGFAVLPVGIRYGDGMYEKLETSGMFWSTFESSTWVAWERGFYYANATVSRSQSTKRFGFSLRCIQD